MKGRFAISWLTAIAEGKFLLLLVFLLLFIGFSPLLHRVLPFRLAYDISFTTVLLAGVNAASSNRRQTILATILAAPMLFFLWYAYGKAQAGVHPVGLAFGILFVGYTIALIVDLFMKAKQITSHLVFASVSAYLLLGVLWSFIYGVIIGFQPNALSIGEIEPYTLLYFSFVTLTTLGYGDIAPITQEARALAILEAVVGQLYLAVIVARLVGIYVANRSDGNKKRGD
jgi:hypothetical protein